MKNRFILPLVALISMSHVALAQVSNRVEQIDLATTLRLARAQNLDVQIAQQRLAEARAQREGAILDLFPTLTPGVSYRRHDDLLQDVTGNIIEVHKDSYAPGATLGGELDLGRNLYAALAARQQVDAARHGLGAQQEEAVSVSAQAYFDLANAAAAVLISQEAVRIAGDYETQIDRGVAAGISFKGDALRVQVQAARTRLALRQSVEQQRIASARLAEVLHLDSAVELIARPEELVPITLVETNRPLDSLVAEALNQRPEIQQNKFAIAAAQTAKNSATYAPFVPVLNGQAFWGGLGGSHDRIDQPFGAQEDYSVGVGWRIGPGGLFDSTRKQAAAARLQITELTGAKIKDAITREVVEAFTHSSSAADQIEIAAQAVTAAREALKLANERKEFAVGIVLETIQAEQDLTVARAAHARAIAEFAKAQYALARAIGALHAIPTSSVSSLKSP